MQQHYPSDLADGVVPLVFVVNAVDSQYNTSNVSNKSANTGTIASDSQLSEDVKDARADIVSNKSSAEKNPVNNDPFEMFVKALSLACSADGATNDSTIEAVTQVKTRPDSATEVHYPEEQHETHEIISGEESSSDEDGIDMPLVRRDGFPLKMRKSIHYIHPSTKQQQGVEAAETPKFFDHVRIIPVSKRHAFPPSKDPTGVNNNNNNAGGIRSTSTAIQQRHNSNTHHPDGKSQRSNKISPNPFLLRRKQLDKTTTSTTTTTDSYSVNESSSRTTKSSLDLQVYPTANNESHSKKQQHSFGIIPVDWIEKHAQWLPSVVLVVTVLDLNLPQASRITRDVSLGEVIDNIRLSLAPKRECRLHLICLVTNHEHLKTAQQKHFAVSQQLTFIRSQCRLAPSSITILNVPLDYFAEAEATTAGEKAALQPSTALRQLHRTIRSMSMTYYLSAARRLKRKIAMLQGFSSTSSSNSNQLLLEQQYHLLPLVIRCQFKIGIYYEFQQKLDKAVKHWTEAYNAVEIYYTYIVNQQRHAQMAFRHQQQLEQVAGNENSEFDSSNSDIAYNRDSYYADLTTSPISPQRRPTTSKIQSPIPEDHGVEVALIMDQQSPGTEFLPPQILNSFSLSDMAYQCRGVADWINFKLMSYAFRYSSLNSNSAGDFKTQGLAEQQQKVVPHPAGSLVQATMQWRRHCQIYLSTQYYRADDLNNDTDNVLYQPLWWHWSYVEHQRLAMAQLAEQYPYRPDAVDADAFSLEVMLTCASWKLYESTAEAMLLTNKLLLHEKKPRPPQIPDEGHITASGGSTISRYVGGMDPDILEIQFHEELKRNRNHLAMQYLEQAISLFYKIEGNRRFGRSSAHMHYLLGNLLINAGPSLDPAPDVGVAIKHLHQALGQVMGWPSLEAGIAKALIKSYSFIEEERWEKDEAIIANSLSFLFRPDIFRFLDPSDVKTLLDRLFSGKATTSDYFLPWPDEVKAPLAFSLTFLEDACYAIAGDKVTACLSVTSRCPFPLIIKSLEISFKSPGVDSTKMVPLSVIKDAIELQPKKTNLLRVIVSLPSSISSDSQLATGGGISGAVLLRSSKTKTAGLTRNGGAIVTAQQNAGSSQPNQAHKIGRSLSCQEISVCLTPGFDDKSLSLSKTAVKLIFTSSYQEFPARIPSNILGTSKVSKNQSDQDNYVMAAWSRRFCVPFYHGPSSLRVHSPTSNLQVVDLTAFETNSKAIDGTVNRIYLRLKAGETELCENISFKIVSLQSTSLPAALIVVEDHLQTLPGARCKSVPTGWRQHDPDEAVDVCRELKPGSDILVVFDLFRPLSSTSYKYPNASLLEPCETSYELQFTYFQHRCKLLRNGQFDTCKTASSKGDKVIYSHSSTLQWSSPLRAQFTLETGDKSFPRGNSLSNILFSSLTNSSSEIEGMESVAADGEAVTVRCTLDSIQEVIFANVNNATFEHVSCVENDSGCELELLSTSGKPPDEILGVYSGSGKRLVNSTCKVGFVYTIRARLKKGVQNASPNLGVLNINWTPMSMYLTQEGKPTTLVHGPLALDSLEAMRFMGPMCKIESVPFDAGIFPFQDTAKVSSPFEVKYWVKNNTPLFQKLSVSMLDAESSGEVSSIVPPDGILVSGLVTGDIVLAPHEMTSLGYSALAIKPGKALLPMLKVSSARYQSWVIKDRNPPRQLYVLP